MSKRDYELVARVLRARRPVATTPLPEFHNLVWGTIVERFADEFAADNTRFNRTLFLEACGYTEVVI